MTVMAYVAKIGRREVGLWRPVAEWKLVKRGKHKNLYRIIFYDGKKGLATKIQGCA